MEYSFGDWVKRRRKSVDLTQQELARRVGCSVATIVKIEAGERRPSRQVAELLAQHLEIPPELRGQFLKVARQESGPGRLEPIPPPPSLERPPARKPAQSHLPVFPTPLVGREHELSIVVKQLLEPACRLLTLTGPGGVGKTRLAVEAGGQLQAHFADGVHFISMAGVGMTESIIPAIADALDLSFSGPADPLLQVANFLRAKDILLVIDNMEHLLEGASLLGEVLRQTLHVRMLVTSREPLRLNWEWLFDVQGLPIPEAADGNLEANSAIALFAQRARQASSGFSVESEDPAALVRICQLVGGLPLAIELAASWVRVLSCREIVHELERSLDLLETRKLDVPQRHRSIRSVFDHSWTLLTEAERTLLMRLSLFQGGFTREAAAVIAGATLSLLSSLVDKSLLRHDRDADRYGLHELIRQYAYARLRSDPSTEGQASEHYAAYYAQWIADLEVPFKSSRQPEITQLIRTETSNWLSAWQWAVAHRRSDLLRRMILCLNWYFEVHGYYGEALSAFKAGIQAFRSHGAPASLQSPTEKSAFAALVDSLGWFTFRTGNVQEAAGLFSESLELAREANDLEILYYIYGNWGYLSLFTGDIAAASRLTTESLVCARALDSAWHIAIPTSVLGIVAYHEGNLLEARRQLTESLDLWRSVGDPRGLVFCLLYLAMATFALQDIPATRSAVEESNRIADANMDRWAHALGLDLLGMVFLSEERNEEALAAFRNSLALSEEIGDPLNGTQTRIHMGRAFAALGEKESAKRLFLEAYARARQAGWTIDYLNALLAFAEIPEELSPETRLGVAMSVLSHPAATPNLRVRCEQLRDEMMSILTSPQIEAARELAGKKNTETLAEAILR